MRYTSPEAEKILDVKFPVLDHGGVALMDYMGNDYAIEAAARVSFVGGEAETRTKAQTEGLIRYLVQHKHTTPLEMVVLKFWVKCPIFVARQWIRHRMSTTNEISARYSTLPDEFYLPSLDRMNKQSVSNKQGSSSDIIPEAAECLEDMETFQERARQDYERYLNADLAKELARINLPVSQYTEFIWKIDLHNLMHFLALRLDDHAQYEIRKYAEVMADMVQKVAPIAFKAFEDYRLNAATVSSPVLDFLASCPDVIEGLRGHGVSERELKELAKKIGVPYAPAQK